MSSFVEQNLFSRYKRSVVFSNTLSDVRKELRQRRKNFLGTYISVCDIVRKDNKIDEDMIHLLSQHLAERTINFWDNKHSDAEAFCFRFYRIALYVLSSGKIGNESIDDIIQIAECLVRSRKVFIIAFKDKIPADMVGEFFDFTESYDDYFFSPTFEDAVLGAICVFLGVLPESECSEVQL